jgi:SAM-dependent methyltransferase
MSAMGQALIALDARPGQRILEYGPGEGVVALEAAKVGCHVTVADIEPLYLNIIQRRADAAGVSVRTVLGEFGCDCGDNYDRIWFYEAFHHALDHAELLKRLHTMLSPAGKLLLIGEPVIGPHNEYWRPTLSYPWGLRLDGLSFRAIQTYGWMELGFDQSYLIEALMRAGFLADFRPSAATDRGSAYVATPYQSEINLGAPFLLLSSGRYHDWHGGEGGHRWTASEEAILPLREHDGTIEVTLVNYHADARDFELETTAATVRGRLAPADDSVIPLAAGSRLVIRSKVRPAGGADPRSIGIAVKSVRFI